MKNTLLLGVWLASFHILVSTSGYVYANPENFAPTIQHQPILIEGDAEFASTASAFSWPGNGSAENPYIIENYEISGQAGYCIYIKNTTCHFVIRSCTLYNASHGSGVELENVTNGVLENITINSTYYGIIIFKCSSCKISNCDISEAYFGIYISACENGTILVENSTVSGCTQGIISYGNSALTISGNTISSCDYGIYCRVVVHNKIINNTVCGVNFTGIYFCYATENNLTGNNIRNTLISGIELNLCENISIRDNIIQYAGSGITLNLTSNSTISNNNISSSYAYGLLLYNNSTQNIVTNNVFIKNMLYAINLTDNSTGNVVHHNGFYNNSEKLKGISSNCQAYDSVGGNIWYDISTQQGNYWSNWDGNGWGTANAYPIDGGKASDWYPLSTPVYEFFDLSLFVIAFAISTIVLCFATKKLSI
ncbi:MAG: right-handed parallel beta-helix repeat-containing protein [Thermoplasmata archaeon]